MRETVVIMVTYGFSYRQINANTKILISTIAAIIKKFKTEKNLETKPRSGRPTLLDGRGKRRIIREVKKKRSMTSSNLRDSLPLDIKNSVSKETLRRTLREQGINARKPFISVAIKKSGWLMQSNM